MDISSLQKYYRGFFIDTPFGNNAFSFDKRASQKIFVPPLVKGEIDDVRGSDEIVFGEIVDGKEVNARGLNAFVHIERPGQDIFVFDNHNHAFFFWCAAVSAGVMPTGLPLVHVDQHKDTRAPEEWPPALVRATAPTLDLQPFFHYTNYVLNVGNFIPPALHLGIFSDVVHVASREAFERDLPARFVLDIDLDIFAPVLSSIPDGLKVERLREWVKKAAFVTVATSPFFIDQQVAIDRLQDILS
jgi:hypothetical protein